ncbi:MAG: ribonuclease HII [Candidatus Geothermarchaeales archaeon]
MHRVLGVDEAGRGPVIGPMVVCGVEVREGEGDLLRELGVRDSKLLTPVRRRELSMEIPKVSSNYILKEIGASEIDEAVTGNRLNYLEARVMAEITREIRPDTVYVDAPMADTGAFAEMLRAHLMNPPEIIAENHADREYPVVAAASVLAKVRRDRRIEELHETYGDFGSGYPSDTKTLRFLEGCHTREGSFPPIVRRSWATIKELEARLSQRKMSDYP